MARRVACLALLDRQLEQLEMDRALMKHELVDKLDQEFDKLRTLTLKIKAEIIETTISVPVQTDNGHAGDQLTLPSTSNTTGQKRKSTGKDGGVVPKRSRNANWICIYPNCGKAFPDDARLARHERTHTGVRPFTCAWRECQFDAVKRSDVVTHIRTVHFKLPATKKDQLALNITDRRDPNRWIRVNQQLVERRLTEADFGTNFAAKTLNRKKRSNSKNVLKAIACKSPGCDFTCKTDFKLANHERAIHLNIRPFHCTWTGCDFTGAELGQVVKHVRMRHFGLPNTVKLQRQLKIEDQRDPNQYVRVVQELADRRL